MITHDEGHSSTRHGSTRSGMLKHLRQRFAPDARPRPRSTPNTDGEAPLLETTPRLGYVNSLTKHINLVHVEKTKKNGTWITKLENVYACTHSTDSRDTLSKDRRKKDSYTTGEVCLKETAVWK